MKRHSWWSASAPEERNICRNRLTKFPAPAERHMQCKLEVEQPGTTGFSRESNQIKLNQTSVKIHPATITSANGAASYQPRATPWVRARYAVSPEGAAQLSHQGTIKAKTPVIVHDQGISRHMQKRLWSSVWPTHPLDRADWQAKGQGVCQGKILSLGRGYR